MRDFIATDSEGNVVGKWRRHDEPTVPDPIDVQEVNDLTDYTVDYWYNDQS